MKCLECNCESFETKSVELRTRVGKYVVVDKSTMAPACKECGEALISADVAIKAELNAAVVMLEDAEPTGAVFRFARKALQMTQAQFADALGVGSAETISRRETGLDIPKGAVIALLGLLRQRLNPRLATIQLDQAG